MHWNKTLSKLKKRKVYKFEFVNGQMMIKQLFIVSKIIDSGCKNTFTFSQQYYSLDIYNIKIFMTYIFVNLIPPHQQIKHIRRRNLCQQTYVVHFLLSGNYSNKTKNNLPK